MKEILIEIGKKLLPFLFKIPPKLSKEAAGIIKDTDYSTVELEEKEKSALIFIHGFGGQQDETWGDTFKYLRANREFAKWDFYSFGYNSGLLPNIFKGIWIGQSDLNDLAFGFRGEIETQLRKGYQTISICAHSMGGLVVQRALLDLDNASLTKIHTIILFGTPSNGLVKADLGGFINDQVRDLGSKSPFIYKLRKDWTQKFGNKPPFKFLAVAGDRDEFVPKPTSIDIFPEDQRKIIGGDHSRIVKPQSASDQTVTTIVDKILNDQNHRYDWEPALMAFERANFQEAKRIYERVGFDNLIVSQQVKYMLCLEALGHRDQAMKFAEKLNKRSSDNSSVLGGRYKRLYLDTLDAKYLKESRSWYQKGFNTSENPEDFYYAAINLAFLSLLSNDRSKATEWASIAEEKANESQMDSLWKYATLGEANLINRNLDEAITYYIKALTLSPTIRDKESMLINAFKSIEILQYSKDQRDQFRKLFLD